jgi:PAS domain S-box-containing protein
MARKTLKMLIVEDSPSDLEQLQEGFLGRKKTIFKMTIVKDLREAAEALEKDSFEIILLDMSLPGSNGIEAYHKIKEKAGNTPVIIMTGSNEDRLAEMAIKDGAQDHIVKENLNMQEVERSIKYAVERKKQEKLLKESEEKYKNIFNYAEVGIFRSKIDGGGLLDFNKRMEDILGYTRRELLALPEEQIWVDERLRGIMRGELKENRVLKDYEAEIVTKNGKIKTVMVSKRLYEKEGFIEGTISDITKLKKWQDTIVESEDRFRSAFEQAAVGMAFMRMDGKFIKVNKRYCEILGYANEELEGMTIEDVLRPEDINNDRIIMKMLIEGKIRVFKAEKQHVRKDKLFIWTELTVSLARNPDNSPKYFVAVIEDISARKEAEERWKAFSDAAEDNMMLWDKDMNLIVANAASNREYEKLTEKKMEPGRPMLELILGLKDTDYYEKFRGVLKTGQPFFINEYGVNVEGKEPRYFSMNAFKVGDDMGLITADITELKRSEIILKNSYEKLKEVDRLKSNFISIVSHELRTPLTIIKGFTSFLIKEAAGTLNDTQKNFVNTIDQNTTRLARIINDMVDMSRIESGIFAVEKESRELTDAIKEAIESMRVIAEEQGVSLERDIEVKSARINIDKGRIIQAITNVINNAIRFSKKGDSIKISLARADKDKIPGNLIGLMADEKSYYCIDVKDTGAGIEKKHLEKIFERFFQEENANVRKHQGAGLGLSIAKNIAEAHGGFIWAESEGAGKGARVSMVLPE